MEFIFYFDTQRQHKKMVRVETASNNYPLISMYYWTKRYQYYIDATVFGQKST